MSRNESSESKKKVTATTTVSGGVQVRTLFSWPEFQIKVADLQARKAYIWRGQRKDLAWPLKSKFDRHFKSRDRERRNDLLKSKIEKFRKAMNQSYPQVPLGSDDNVWALGQHYGLKTPLLDWTLSPYIAAYFAFAEPSDGDDQYRYVYALQKSISRLIVKPSRQTFVEVIEKLDFPSPRFSVQRSVFTKALDGDDIETNVRRFIKLRPNRMLLVKFQIPASERKKCLDDLDMMNINYGTLLLDLRDVVDMCEDI